MSEDMKEIDECDMEKFVALDTSEITIAVLGDRRWPQKAKQDGDKVSKTFLCNQWGTGLSSPMLETSLLRVGRVLGLEQDAWLMVK